MAKISQYPAKTVFHDQDLIDISNTEDDGVTYDESQKATLFQIRQFLKGGLFDPLNNNGIIQTLLNPTINPYTAFITNQLVWDGRTLHKYSGPADTPFYEESFTSGSLATTDFTTSGDALWFVDNTKGQDDSFSAASGTILDFQTTSLFLTKITTVESTILDFYYDLSTEDGFDGLQIFIDGVLVKDIRTSSAGWVPLRFYLIGIGSHTIEWRYRKDGGASGGDDRVWIDNVRLTNFNPRFESDVDGQFRQNLIVLGTAYFRDLQVLQNIVTNSISVSEELRAKKVIAGKPTVGIGQFHNNELYGVDIEGINIPDGSNIMMSKYDNTRIFSENSDTFRNVSDANPYSMIFGFKAANISGENFILVAQSKDNGASHLTSRLQIGYSTPAPDQSNMNTLDVNGNIEASEPITVNGMRANIRVAFSASEVSHTGNTTETIVQTLFIPANTFITGDMMDIYGLVTTDISAFNTSKLYLNTTPDLLGTPVDLMILGVNTRRVTQLDRKFQVINNTTLSTFTRGDFNATTYDPTTNSFYSAITGLDFTSDMYLVWTVQLTNASAIATTRGININKI